MRFALLIAALLATPAVALAETIDVDVRRPAVENDIYMLRSLSVERFGGTDGRAFSFALERTLAGLRDADGRELFGMFDAGAGEAAVSGRADVEVIDGRYVEKRRLCPGTFNRNAKCEDAVKAEVEVNCRSRVIALDADVRVSRTADGRLMLSRDVPQRSEARWCNGDPNPGEIQGVVADLIRRAASDATSGFAPTANVIPIRIRESRRGLDKAVSAQFKSAVEATRGNGEEGCARFEALEPVIPNHGPLIYNLALCAEARGDYVGAVAGFQRVGDREALDAAIRARDTEVAKKQFEARQES